jgi:UDPglucose 6-dehydrogenase
LILGIVGLGHLGTVAAACMAKHHRVLAFGTAGDIGGTLSDPDLLELWDNRLTSGCLMLYSCVASHEALKECDVVWLCVDTPVDERGSAWPEHVAADLDRALEHANPGATVLVSSQVPVGWTKKQADKHPQFSFAYHPENLRVGKGLHGFRNPGRIVLGVENNAADRQRLTELFTPICDRLMWMSIESAEMVKHGINAFLSTSIAFAKELHAIGRAHGANPDDVTAGMKSDPRIGQFAYVSDGGGPGAHLLRDTRYLANMGPMACDEEQPSFFRAVESAHWREAAK